MRRDLIPHRGLTKCICGYDFQHLDAFPSHFLFCEKYRNSSGLLRHNRILEQSLSFCRTAGIVATSYPRQPGGELSSKQPDGQQFFDETLNFSDVTVRHPCSPSYLNRFKGNPGKLLDSAVTQKITKYLLWCKERGASFSALAITSYGGLSEEFFNFLRKIANHADASSFSSVTDRDKFLNRMVQSTVATLMKGNSWMYRKGIHDSRRKYGFVMKAADKAAVAEAIKSQKEARRNEIMHAWSQKEARRNGIMHAC